MNPERVREVLGYCPLTGNFWWKRRSVSRFKTERAAKTWNSRFADKSAGSYVGHSGRYYLAVELEGKKVTLHRAAFAIMEGEWPNGMIDHVNGDRSDNRWENLRRATRNENQRNQKLYSNNKSGRSGVYWRKSRSKWVVRARVNGRIKTVGSFHSLTEAIQARDVAYQEMGFTDRHGKPTGLKHPEPPEDA